ncbi:hypothetical protein ACA910_008807 [Epithemia clementina (nom. ined.)]
MKSESGVEYISAEEILVRTRLSLILEEAETSITAATATSSKEPQRQESRQDDNDDDNDDENSHQNEINNREQQKQKTQLKEQEEDDINKEDAVRSMMAKSKSGDCDDISTVGSLSTVGKSEVLMDFQRTEELLKWLVAPKPRPRSKVNNKLAVTAQQQKQQELTNISKGEENAAGDSKDGKEIVGGSKVGREAAVIPKENNTATAAAIVDNGRKAVVATTLDTIQCSLLDDVPNYWISCAKMGATAGTECEAALKTLSNINGKCQ